MSPAESMVAVESMSGLVLGKFRPGRSAAELLEEADRHLQNAGHVLEHNDELIADLTLQNSLQVLTQQAAQLSTGNVSKPTAAQFAKDAAAFFKHVQLHVHERKREIVAS